ncbi:hypothetical protein HZH68_000907 [Vespula germanica]|uniref:Uncharacterized protein n=2 Tax=Vespula TaxID=7451 RepID=A0A834NV30_VESGE|nr:hypothetical protein HZH68_000907 [Vespula germanica]KAF7438593.1 hypothetical protein H0235_000984 [Vespula pensylvanica]
MTKPLVRPSEGPHDQRQGQRRQNKEHRSVACSIINGKHISARGCTNYYPQLSPSENSGGVEESGPTMAVWKVVVVIVEVGRTASHGRVDDHKVSFSKCDITYSYFVSEGKCAQNRIMSLLEFPAAQSMDDD